jgi:hypothetical protein
MGDFLAFVQIGAGGSWGRGPTEEQALEHCALSIRDWKGLLDVLGKDVEVGLYDVTGHDSLTMEPRGVFDSESNETIPMLKTAKVHVPTDEELEAKELEKAQQYTTPEQVVAAYWSDDAPLGFEVALKRLQQMGLSEKQADNRLLD